LTCFAIFHNRIAAFCQDFLVAFLGYKFGVKAAAIWLGTISLGRAITKQQIEFFEKPSPAYYQQFADSEGSVLEFIDSLDKDKIDYLLTLPDKEIFSWLRTADWKLFGVHYIDMGEAFALVRFPLRSLWRLYEHFYKSVPFPAKV